MSDNLCHWFYGIARQVDYLVHNIKLGHTENPYNRISQYGSGSMNNDPMKFRFLIGIEISCPTTILTVEKKWLSKFPEIPSSESSDEEDLNRASSVEARSFQGDEKTIIKAFKQALLDLDLDTVPFNIYNTNESINIILKKYRALVKEKPQANKSYSGWDLYDYQKTDIKACIDAFKSGQRRQHLDIACGLGKTLITYEILRSMKGMKNVIVSSREKLVKQFCVSLLNDWNFPAADVYTCFSGQALPSVKNISSYDNLPHNPIRPYILVTTYDSFVKMKRGTFSFAVFDEGHHLVLSSPQDISGDHPRNQYGLHDSNITIENRLIVTATIKDVVYRQQQPNGMPPEIVKTGFTYQPELFGNCTVRRDYKFGKDNKFLVPFKAIALKINESSLLESIKRLRNVFGFNNTVLKCLELSLAGQQSLETMESLVPNSAICAELQLWYAIVADAIILACSKHNRKRVITYHTNIDHATEFSKIMNILIPKYPSVSMTCDVVSSKNGTDVNEEKCVWFSSKDGHDVKVLANCRTLIEGFDEKSVDMTVFVDNKYSALECIQIVGRGNRIDRTNPDKCHYIFLPFLCETQENSLKTSNDYHTARYILKNVLESCGNVEQCIWIPLTNDLPEQQPKPKSEIIYNPPEIMNDRDENIRKELTTEVETNELSKAHFNNARLWAHNFAKELLLDPDTEKVLEGHWKRYIDNHSLPPDIPYNPKQIYGNVGWCTWADYFGLTPKQNLRISTLEDIDLLIKNGMTLHAMTRKMFRVYVEDKISRKIPDSFVQHYKTSVYDIGKQQKNKQYYINIWGKYQDKLYDYLRQEHIIDTLDFESDWAQINAKNQDIPGMPNEVWSDFWSNYTYE